VRALQRNRRFAEAHLYMPSPGSWRGAPLQAGMSSSETALIALATMRYFRSRRTMLKLGGDQLR